MTSGVAYNVAIKKNLLVFGLVRCGVHQTNLILNRQSVVIHNVHTKHRLFDLVNKTNLVHNLFLVYVYLYLLNSTCFGRLCAHHQEKQLYLCDTWYLLFCVDDGLVCRVLTPCIPESHPYRITSTKCRINTVVSPDDGHIIARNMQNLINMNTRILRINCAPSWFYLQDCTEMNVQQNIKTDYLIPELISVKERLKQRCLPTTIVSTAK